MGVFSKTLLASLIFVSAFLFHDFCRIAIPVEVLNAEGGLYNLLVDYNGEENFNFQVSGEWLISLRTPFYSPSRSSLTILIYREGEDQPLLTLRASFNPSQSTTLERVSGVEENNVLGMGFLTVVRPKNEFYPNLPPGNYVMKVQWENVEWSISIKEYNTKIL